MTRGNLTPFCGEPPLLRVASSFAAAAAAAACARHAHSKTHKKEMCGQKEKTTRNKETQPFFIVRALFFHDPVQKKHHPQHNPENLLQ